MSPAASSNGDAADSGAAMTPAASSGKDAAASVTPAAAAGTAVTPGASSGADAAASGAAVALAAPVAEHAKSVAVAAVAPAVFSSEKVADPAAKPYDVNGPSLLELALKKKHLEHLFLVGCWFLFFGGGACYSSDIAQVAPQKGRNG